MIQLEGTNLLFLQAHPSSDFFIRLSNAFGRRFRISRTAIVRFPCGPLSLFVLRQSVQEQVDRQILPLWKQSQYNLRHLVLEHLQPASIFDPKFIETAQRRSRSAVSLREDVSVVRCRFLIGNC